MQYATEQRRRTRLSPDEHAAALTMHEARVRDADALVRSGDIEAANAARA